MKWDWEKAIHEELVGELKTNTSWDGCSNTTTFRYFKGYLAIGTKEGPQQGWEALSYHEESKEKESCNNIGIKSTKAIKQLFGIKEILIILKGKLKGMFDDQNLNIWRLRLNWGN
jgi:hypothetical protein